MLLCALLVRLRHYTGSHLSYAHYNYIRYLIQNFGNVDNLEFNMW